MPSFSYKAVDGSGQPISGVLTAENYQVALRQLDEKALYPVRVTEGIERSAFTSTKRVKRHHLTAFYSQLADLLRSGVPMLRSLDVLSRQESSGSLVQIIKELREDISGGSAMGDAMGKHPHAFAPLHASMVRAGEQGGFLEDVLQRIAIFSERQDELKNKVLGAMIYPAILTFVGSGIVTLLLVFVVPKFREHLRPETFNFLTVGVFAISDFVRDRYVVLGLAAAVIATALTTWAKTDHGRRVASIVQLRAPILGKIMTMVAMCRFCRILGTMLHNGVPILQALRISKDSAGNEILANVIEKAGDSVKKGAALSAPLGESGLFPLAVVDMISVAEESNSLETVLVQIAETNEVRTARQIDLGVRILEPILLTFMAGIVFCVMMALLLPILTMGSTIQG